MSKKSKNKKKQQSELDSNTQQSGAIGQSTKRLRGRKLQVELVKLQDRVKATNARAVQAR